MSNMSFEWFHFLIGGVCLYIQLDFSSCKSDSSCSNTHCYGNYTFKCSEELEGVIAGWCRYISVRKSGLYPPVEITVNLLILDLDKISEADMSFRAQVVVVEEWRNPDMNVSFLTDVLSEDRGDRSLPHVVVRCMWKPDTIFINIKRAELFVQSIPNVVYAINKNQTFKRTSRYNLIVTCNMDLHLYPMDIQKCDFRIVLLKSKSWVASLKWKAKKPIEFYGKPSALAFVIHLPSVGFHLSKRTNKVILGVHFVFERRVKGAILTVYLPSALVTVCSWLSFWIGVAAAPARVTLGVTALLTLMTQMARVKGQLPPIDYIMTMDIWMFTNIAFVVASLMEFGVAFNLEGRFTYESVHDARNKEKPTPKPRISAIKAWPKQKSKCHFVETVKMRDKREWTTPVPLYDSRWSDPRSTTGKSPRGRICSLRSFMQVFGKGEAVNPADYASRIIFPVAWISFVTFYWVNYLYIDQRWDWNV